MRVCLHSASAFALQSDRLFIHFLGPVLRTKRGNIAMLVVVVSFSNFVSFRPVRKMTSSAVSDYLEIEYFPAYGTPKFIVTDNAKVFGCKEFRDLCFRWGIEHLTTNPYYPRGSLADRVNRNMNSTLKIFNHESQSSWDEYLPCLSLAFTLPCVRARIVLRTSCFWGAS